MEVKLYDDDLSSPTLDMDLSHRVEGLRFSTRLHGGFHQASFRINTALPEAWEILTGKYFYRLVITDGAKTLWEGRLEDIKLNPRRGSVILGAYGYYANLDDVPYHTAYNTYASVAIKAVLTACCTQISSDQSNIQLTDITIDSAAADGYVDIYPRQIVEKLLAFSDTTSLRWYFAIWEDRVPYLTSRDDSTLDWVVQLQDFSAFDLQHKASEMWNQVYAIYRSSGTLTRTSDADDLDSQGKYGLTRQYVIPDLGEVTAFAAGAQRDAFLQEHKDIWPTLSNMVLGQWVYDANGKRFPSWWLRAGQVLRVRDLVPASADAGSVARDALRTFYIVETEYNVDEGTMRLIPDTEHQGLDSILVRRL